MSKEKQIELLEKQLAFWKHHAASLSKALDDEEETANRYAEMLDKTEEELNDERAKSDKWYHEYHVIKDELKQEKAYHIETNKLVDKYFNELQTAKSETAREIFAKIIEEYELDGMTYLDEILCGHLKKFIDELEKKYIGE